MGAGSFAAKGLFCFCGMKGAIFFTAVSVWGTIMLGLLGVCFTLQAVALFEDIEGSIHSHDLISVGNLTKIQVESNLAYQNAAISCFGAAAFYLIVLVLSSVMIVVNVFRPPPPKAKKTS